MRKPNGTHTRSVIDRRLPFAPAFRVASRFDDGAAVGRRLHWSHLFAANAFAVVMVLLWLLVVQPHYLTHRINRDVDHFTFDGVRNLTEIALGSPHSAAWVAHPHLVAIGVMMGLDAHSSMMREVQRQTWVTYPQVARLATAFNGLVMPLYVMGLKQKWPPYIDVDMQQLARDDGDIVFMRLVEQVSTTGKRVGEERTSATDYGSPSMVTNARKVSLWFRYAYQHFPLTPFLAKADLDTYINIPAYLAIVQQLPRISTKFGRTRPIGRCLLDNGECFSYVLGPLYTNTRDIAREVFTEPTLMQTFSEPYTRCKLSFYRAKSFLNEDVVHSRTLHRLYADGAAPRAFPSQELADAQRGAAALPPVAGMGKLYMDYILNPGTTLPLSGEVDGLEGMRYHYTLPEQPKRTNIVYVLDNCRFPDYENATTHGLYHVILHHTYSAAIAHEEHERHKDGNTFGKMKHPASLNFTSHRSFFYQVELSSLEC